jgi:5-methylcytosine-specific restriction enzyme subunit McrC
LSRYVPHADDLTVVKGQFRVHEQLRRNLARPQLLHCEFDEFTVDNPYNRAVRATLAACRGFITRTDTQRLWFEVQSRYAVAAPIAMSAREVARLPRDRLTQRYGSLLTWCERLLEWSSPSLSAGTGQAPGLLFDMNKLFEAHVGALEEQHAGAERIVRRQAPQVMLASSEAGHAFQLKPDITVWHPATSSTPQRIDRVVDAKWKHLNPMAADCGVEESDLYQVLAYALGYQCSRLELVYPATTASLGGQTLRWFKVGANSSVSWSGDDVHVEIRTVSPWS